MNSFKNDHIPVIVCLRGIAAIGVVLFHFVCTTSGFIEDNTIRKIFDFGKLGVPLFFLISGVVIPLHLMKTNYSHQQFSVFFLRRLMRVEPAYFVALFCSFLILLARDMVYGSSLRPSVTELFLHIGYLIPFFSGSTWISPVFWTLAIEFQYYLFLALIFPYLNHKNRGSLLAIIFLILGICLLFTDRSNLMYWLPIFFMGIAYAFYRQRQMPLIDYLLVSLFCTGIIVSRDVQIGILLLAGLCIIHFLPNLKTRALYFLGEISYSLYLFHCLTGSVLINTVSHYVFNPWLKSTLVLCGLLFAILSAKIVYRLVEKPSHDLARRIS